MNLLILALSHLLHVLGTVVWIGGILMTLLVILPGSKAALESAPMVGKMMKEVAKRFTPLANISILLLIATGIIIFYYDKNYTSFIYIKNRWNVLIALKHVLVAIMIIIHFYRGLILSQKIEKSSSKPNEMQIARLKIFFIRPRQSQFCVRNYSPVAYRGLNIHLTPDSMGLFNGR